MQKLILVVIAWYGLGIVSISTTKLLLLANVQPLELTFQQFLLGSSLLRLILKFEWFGSSFQEIKGQWPPLLRKIGIWFSLGFLATNYGFSGSAVSLVETVKAAEPITSAIVAVSFGVDTLNYFQTMSLCTIVAGVLYSTLQQRQSHQDSPTDSAMDNERVVASCSIVLIANLCFSFRGLNQKLYRQRKGNEPQMLDDINLQFRAQSQGVFVFLVPFLVYEAISAPSFRATVEHHTMLRYVGLSVVNALAFTSYNLASTSVLSQLSVVHHATLNCLRRVVAIIVTSLLFGLPLRGLPGVGLAVAGFLSYIHSKQQRKQHQPREQTKDDAEMELLIEEDKSELP